MTSRKKKRVVDDTEPSSTTNFAIIQNVYKELNFPSSDKLKGALKSRGIPFNSKEIDRTKNVKISTERCRDRYINSTEKLRQAVWMNVGSLI